MERTLKLALLASAAFLLAHAVPAHAQTKLADTTMNVSASVIPKCTITASGSFDFGPIDVTVPVVSATKTGNLTVTCTKSRNAVNYQLRLSSLHTLQMTNGTDSLPYTLKVNNADWTSGPISVSSSSKSTPVIIPIEASIAGGNLDLSDGDYSDTITAEIWL
jgi:spore coat protein U-like protein